MATVIIESIQNSLILVPNNNQIAIESVDIYTVYYFLVPTQIIPDHEEVG